MCIRDSGILIANLAVELDMQVVGYDPYISVDAAWKLSRQVRHAESLEAVLKTADYVTIHVPLTPQTKNLIAASQLKLMKTGAVLLNFARGGLVQEDAVLAALAARQIRGYVTDFPKMCIRDRCGNVPLIADCSSCILSEPMEISRYGLIFAGAQKNMGIAGLTVVIVREDLIQMCIRDRRWDRTMCR